MLCSLRLGVRERVGDLAKQLVFQQPSDQLGSGVLVFPEVAAPRQEHLRLDAHERRGHLQELAGPLQAQVPLDSLDRRDELTRDLRDRDVEDVDVLRADQVEQQVERALERLEVDDELVVALRDAGTRRRG